MMYFEITKLSRHKIKTICYNFIGGVSYENIIQNYDYHGDGFFIDCF